MGKAMRHFASRERAMPTPKQRAQSGAAGKPMSFDAFISKLAARVREDEQEDEQKGRNEMPPPLDWSGHRTRAADKPKVLVKERGPAITPPTRHRKTRHGKRVK